MRKTAFWSGTPEIVFRSTNNKVSHKILQIFLSLLQMLMIQTFSVGFSIGFSVRIFCRTALIWFLHHFQTKIFDHFWYQLGCLKVIFWSDTEKCSFERKLLDFLTVKCQKLGHNFYDYGSLFHDSSSIRLKMMQKSDLGYQQSTMTTCIR